MGHAKPIHESFGIFVCDKMGRVKTYARSKDELDEKLMKKLEVEKYSEKDFNWLIKPYN